MTSAAITPSRSTLPRRRPGASSLPEPTNYVAEPPDPSVLRAVLDGLRRFDAEAAPKATS